MRKPFGLGMVLFGASMAVAPVAAAASSVSPGASSKQERPSATAPASADSAHPVWAGLTVGKDTTLLTAPLREDGTVDYVAALNSRFGKGVTRENNAFVALLPAVGVGPKRPAIFDDHPEILLLSVAAAGGDPHEQGCFVEWSSGTGTDAKSLGQMYVDYRSKPWVPKDSPYLDDWLNANAKSLGIIREATKLSRYWIPLVSTDGTLTGVSRGEVHLANRDVAVALGLRAMRSIGMGNCGEAWEDLAAVHRQARLLAQDCDMTEYFCGLLNERRALAYDRVLLQNSQSEKSLLSQIVLAMDSYAPLPQATEVFRREKYYSFFDAVQSVATGSKNAFNDRVPAKDRAQWKELSTAFGLWTPDWDRIARSGSQFYSEQFADPVLTDADGFQKWMTESGKAYKNMADASDKDGPDGPERFEDPLSKSFLWPRTGETQATYSDRIGRRLLSIMAPNIRDSEIRALVVAKELELMKAAFAIQLFHAETGAYPDSAEIAAKKYLKVTPTDFWNKPIRYIHTDSGFSIESLGPLAATRDEAEKNDQFIEIEVRAQQ